MNKKEFSQLRSRLGKTQKQMAQLLGVSLKAIQSFEQGYRKVPVHTERQSLLLLALKISHINRNKPCWALNKCPMETRRCCPAWEFGAGQMCWLINGTICRGKAERSWTEKMKKCRKCRILQSALESSTKQTA